MQISLKVIAALFSLFITVLLPQSSFAFSWQDFWFTKNQQAAKLYSRGEIKKAATQFSNPLWKGVANYHSGQYKKAIDDFSKEDTSLANYNRGNALTHTANYQQAIAAYNRALKKDPDFKDALYNKKLLEKFLKQQSKKSKQSSKQLSKQSISRDDNHNKNRNNQSRQNKTNQADQNNQTEPPSSQHQTSQQKKDHTKPQPQSQQQQQQQQQQKSNNQQEKDNAQNSVSHSQQQKKQQQQKQQALKQWLQQIPDNPGGLLREKFLRDHWHLQMKGRIHENN